MLDASPLFCRFVTFVNTGFLFFFSAMTVLLLSAAFYHSALVRICEATFSIQFFLGIYPVEISPRLIDICNAFVFGPIRSVNWKVLPMIFSVFFYRIDQYLWKIIFCFFDVLHAMGSFYSFLVLLTDHWPAKSRLTWDTGKLRVDLFTVQLLFL